MSFPCHIGSKMLCVGFLSSRSFFEVCLPAITCVFGARDTNRATSAILIRQIWSAVYVRSDAFGSDAKIEGDGVQSCSWQRER